MSKGFVYVQPDDANTVKTFPSLSNRELLELLGERGVYASSSASLISCFDIWLHSKGRLFYRLKPGLHIGDSYDYFIPRNDSESVHILITHELKDGEIVSPNILENSHSIDACDVWDEIKK